jgi:hypothetical protein
VSPDCPPESAPRPRRPLGVTGLMISARLRVAFLVIGFFRVADFFLAPRAFFAASFLGAAFFAVFFRAEGALLAADLFRVGFFLPIAFFLRAGFFLAIGKVYQILLSLRSNRPAARFLK